MGRPSPAPRSQRQRCIPDPARPARPPPRARRVYERGVSLFKYPHVKDIWVTYLTAFVARYGGKKVERARDLFRQAIDESPPEACKPLFLAYAKYEEEHGLARNAMQVRPHVGGAGCAQHRAR